MSKRIQYKKIYFSTFIIFILQLLNIFQLKSQESVNPDFKDSTNKVWIYLSDKNIINKVGEDITDIPIFPEYLSELRETGINIVNQSIWLNAVSALATTEQIHTISKFDFIKKIEQVQKLVIYKTDEIPNNFPPKIEDTFSDEIIYYGESYNQVKSIQVPEIHHRGFTGKGIKICIMDTGFDCLNHEVFENLNIIATYDFVNKHESVKATGDDLGKGRHGNAVLSTIAGYNIGVLIGPAYNASYILCKTENTFSEQQIEEDNWVAAAEWAANLGVDIISSSLGYKKFDNGTNYSGLLDGKTTVITQAASIAARKGILVINSAGNSGKGYSTINAPADADSILTVGAVDFDGKICLFSSVGPTNDGRIKPDLVAPGYKIFTADTIDNKYISLSGTSFSCPLVAGCAALLMEMVPDATNTEIIEAFKNTASNSSMPDNNYGWGSIRTLEAYKYLTGAVHISSNNTKDIISIFPNPSSDFINVTINEKIPAVIKIIDLSGELIFKSEIIENLKIDISKFKPGIYILSTSSLENKIFYKLIVR